jgi:hypothetical protein
MKTTALATILSLGLASFAMAATDAADDELDAATDPVPVGDAATDPAADPATTDTAADPVTDDADTTAAADIDLPDIPSEDEATLADCRIWVSTLGEMIERGEGDEDALAEAEDVQDEAMRACDDGNYHDGIVMAAEAIERIDADADAADALDDDHEADAADEDNVDEDAAEDDEDDET